MKEVQEPRRVSLRARGQDPDGTMAKSIQQESEQRMALEQQQKQRIKGTIDLKNDADDEEKLDLAFLEQLQSLNEEPIEISKEFVVAKNNLQDYKISIPLGSVKVTKEMVYSIEFHPSPSKLIAFVGEKKGYLALWDVSDTLSQCETVVDDEIDPVVHLFKPHTRSISKIMHHPTDLNKIFTSAYDGSVRVFDVVAQKFDEVSHLIII